LTQRSKCCSSIKRKSFPTKEINNRFDITPKEAREVLNKFIIDRRKSDNKKSEFSVVYLLAMENKETKTKKIVLVNENELTKYDDEYKTLSKQVYSIQLKPNTDFDQICACDAEASSNINRKSNLTVIHNQNGENMDTSNASSKKPDESSISRSNSSQLNKLTINDTSNVLKPSKESNIEKPNKPEPQKDHSKEAKVAHKEEPKEKPAEPVPAKKVKVESSEPAVTTQNIAALKNQPTAKPAAAKPAKAAAPAAKSTAKQSTLNSFFKKA